jgi:hypothetical protein
MKRKLFIGLLTIAAIGTMLLAIQQNMVTTIGTTTPQVCMTSEEFLSSQKFEVKSPTYLPDGYSLQCLKAELFQTFAIYAPDALSTTEVDRSISEDRAVVVVVNDGTMGATVQPASPEDRVKEDTRLITPELAQEMNAKYLTINGNPAWVREAGDYGVQTIQYANGTILSEAKTHEPARLNFYIGTNDYVVVGDVPGEELIKMAESIK